MKARYRNGIYRDCRFCGGEGCLACPGEADRAYKREFPDGPQPIAVVSISEPGFRGKIESLLIEHTGASEGDAAVADAVDWIVEVMKKGTDGDDTPESDVAVDS